MKNKKCESLKAIRFSLITNIIAVATFLNIDHQPWVINQQRLHYMHLHFALIRFPDNGTAKEIRNHLNSRY